MFPPDDTDISEVRLREVDKVLELIKDLSSKDCNISEDAVKRADEYLKKGKTGFSKTLINKSDLNSANMGSKCFLDRSRFRPF
ncbi:unnamed protein product [Dicrocoelium dendriticum]|nr:unnamed protein product [Dicrocoelium dendriticum]